ncbi:restriction endonuclease subunit S [Chitinophaga sp. GbtcB8]|uniref:restriction endonuclease subunit S n=1 Tax=Chitinophaga sp. GbtcB8 TaxID=2824753 RepID=UPI001C303AAF|nr:restriction endonuclease subunit S [Chitinophaga sp. GbtcB8]
MSTWRNVTLGEVCDILDSKRKPITKKHRVEGQYPYYGATGVLSYVDDYIFSERLVLIGEDGAKWGAGDNTAFIVEGRYWVNNHAHVIRPHMSKVIDKWIVYFLNFSDLSKYITGLTVPKLNQEKMRGIVLPLPSFQEQKQIVALLDKAFAALDKAKANVEQNLNNAKELFENYLNEVFENRGDDWEEKILAQIAISFGRGKSKHRPRNDKKLYGGKYPFIQTGDIRNSNHFITKYTQTYNEIGLAQSKLWPKGTICITIAANIAETGILDFDACFPDSIIGLVVNEKVADLHFVEFLLQSFKVYLQSKSKGSAQDNINLGTFENELFPFPPLKEQKSIVSKLNTLYMHTIRLEEMYEQKLAQLEDLKKSILKKAFSGELTNKPIPEYV